MAAATAEARIDPESGLVLFQSQDDLSYEEWEHAVRVALGRSGGRIQRVLSDRRRLSLVYPPGLVEGATSFVLAHATEFADTHWAVLMRDEAAAHTAANAAMGLMETTLQVKVFTELRPALAWLFGVDAGAELDRLELWVEGVN